MRRGLIGTILLFCVLAIGCAAHRAYQVPTGAMQPTIKIGDYAVADEEFYQSGKPVERFDLVVHKAPLDEVTRKQAVDENTRFIFRVVGLGGEKIEIRKGRIYINDRPLEEPFERISSSDDYGPLVIPENEYFLLGDNRPESNDSRYWKQKTVRREDIFGKVVRIY